MTEPDQTPPYTVVVGVSGTSKSPTALQWARAQAESHGGRLVAVRVYRVPNVPAGPSGTSSRVPPDPADLHAEQVVQLQRDVAEVLGEDHGVELRVVRGNKRRGLIDEARGADLLVIDAPRTPSMSPLLAHRIVYAAPCPVVVMPPSISGAPPSPLSRSAQAVGRAALRSAATSGRAGFRPPPSPLD
ncbi:Nucleotide-binding universal stress protein, UspA family [Nocardioides scoriae]|uniref:Nucleotide-binding universal stress protein, UspA family n=1 Tax=Nocardioides scoriae TaxID=642780 RepID=A0A1H1PA26_9ACTN|nr:universal stress protein [Nocardioides scoriae]SDS08003.1 Nucleotide-binding universal stress protein, UspA family [Nocardioides scoriae]